MSLLALGTVAFDSIETPFDKIDHIIGGSCNYIAWSASHLTNNILISAVVGKDYPKEELNLLKKRDVHFEGLEILDGKSFFWAGKYHLNFNQRDTIKTELNVLENFQPILPKSYKQANYVMLGNLTPQIQLDVLNQLEKKPTLTALDTMNYWIENETTSKTLFKVLKQVDLLIINDEEARLLGKEHSLVKCAQNILTDFGNQFLIIKKGEHGALYQFSVKNTVIIVC